MPAKSWGIDARLCGTGSKLARIKGTPCSTCYARKGNYCRTNVRNAMRIRYEALTHPEWKQAMVVLISHGTPMAVPFFRWFDSGDLQSYQHLLDIVWIARELPKIKFWLPTQERRYLRKFKQEGQTTPPNLVIRYSSPVIDRSVEAWPTTSMVTTQGDTNCHAQSAESLDGTCGSCRKCWDPSIKEIRYKKH